MDLAGDIVQNLCSFLAIQVVMITVFLFFLFVFKKSFVSRNTCFDDLLFFWNVKYRISRLNKFWNSWETVRGLWPTTACNSVQQHSPILDIFTLWRLVSTKRSHMLKQTCSRKMLVCFVCLFSGHQALKC